MIGNRLTHAGRVTYRGEQWDWTVYQDGSITVRNRRDYNTQASITIEPDAFRSTRQVLGLMDAWIADIHHRPIRSSVEPIEED